MTVYDDNVRAIKFSHPSDLYYHLVACNSLKQVGVQTMIEPNAGASALEDKVNAAHPISVGVEGDDAANGDGNKDAAAKE